MDAYLSLKSLHILGAVLFLGNIIVTGVWKALADRDGRPEIVGFAQRLVNLTDWVFTLGGVVLVLATGFAMAWAGGLSLTQTAWLRNGLAIFTVSGLIWVCILVPIQIEQGRLAREFKPGAAIAEDYWQLNRRWFFWGIVATIIPLLNLGVMVFK